MSDGTIGGVAASSPGSSGGLSWPRVLGRLTDRQGLLRRQAAWAMDQIMTGTAQPAQIAA
ncbi:MAG: anthranilate phosphoribosyltransferase, partial [Mycobacteriaceae bacterium]|nr:anthranilate phosphoribosyltransferase [Mycobacteriaceae bacterium]